MLMDTYQRMAATTALYDDAVAVEYNVLKLAGEAGEVADKVGKHIANGARVQDMDDRARHDILLELGDVLWHLAMLSRSLGAGLSYVASLNLSKLSRRANQGTIQGEGDHR